jgi:hypothetical protein
MSAGDPSLDPTLRSVALWCIAVGRPLLGSGRQGTCTMRFLVTLSIMDQNLCCRLMPRAKFGRSSPTTAAAAPATFRWSTFRLSGVSKWPLPQISGIAMGSRLRPTEKHTTSVLVAPKHAPATNFNGLHRRAPDHCVGPFARRTHSAHRRLSTGLHRPNPAPHGGFLAQAYLVSILANSNNFSRR